MVHRCYDCRGSIGGVMIVVVASVVLLCYDCRGSIGGVMIVVVASVVL